MPPRTKSASTGDSDKNFGNAETIPASPKYIANFEGDEIDGVIYSLGDEIPKPGKPMPDPGTLRYLVQIGRITEKAEGDSDAPAGGTTEASNPAGLALSAVTPTRNMDRAALIAELTAGIGDEELREALERKRRAVAVPLMPDGDEFDAEAFANRNVTEITDDALRALPAERLAEVREAEVAGRNRPSLLTRIDTIAKETQGGEADDGPLSTEEIVVRDKLVEDNDEAALRAMAEGLPGIKSDSDKGEIATAIVMSRRKD
jgi:hypothetical protein